MSNPTAETTVSFDPADPRIIYYGPHECGLCAALIVKAAREQGGATFDMPVDGPYPNTVWGRHTCDPARVAAMPRHARPVSAPVT